MSSFLANLVMVVAATRAGTATEFIVSTFSPASAERRFAMATALARVSRTCLVTSEHYFKHSGPANLHEEPKFQSLLLPIGMGRRCIGLNRWQVRRRFWAPS